MSQNTIASINQINPPVYAGLDIAKATLQLHCQGKSCDLSNTASGHTQLLKRLAAIWAEAFEESRRKAIPQARAAGIYTDEDVFKIVP
jgi:hypothetical protein